MRPVSDPINLGENLKRTREAVDRLTQAFGVLLQNKIAPLTSDLAKEIQDANVRMVRLRLKEMDAIDGKVAENLQCRVLAEGANGPTTPDADLVLDTRRNEIFLIPDILCNSGGVVVSYFEWVQDLQQLFWEEEEVMRREYHILDRAFEQMLARAKSDNISHRTAAMAIGVEKVRAAKNTRGLFP